MNESPSNSEEQPSKPVKLTQDSFEPSSLHLLYQEDLNYCRHHELQRAAATGVIFTLSAGAFGMVGLDQAVTWLDLPVLVIVLILACTGIHLSKKHYERYKFHSRRALAIRKTLDDLLPEVEIVALFKEVKEAHEKEFPFKRSLGDIWTRLHRVLLWLAIAGLLYTLVDPVKAGWEFGKQFLEQEADTELEAAPIISEPDNQ